MPTFKPFNTPTIRGLQTLESQPEADQFQAIATRAAAPTFIRVHSSQLIYMNVPNALTGLKEWVLVGGEGVQSGWGKYVVSPGVAPTTMYATVAAAQLAAEADGHGPANPTAILILAGTLTEDVTLKPGFNYVGLTPSQGTQQPTIRGAATLGAGAGTVTVTNLRFVSATDVPLTLGGVDAVAIELQSVVAHREDATEAALFNNANIASRIRARDCAFRSDVSSGGVLVDMTTDGPPTVFDRCTFATDRSDCRALRAQSDTVLTRCTVTGQLHYLGVLLAKFPVHVVRDTTVVTDTQPCALLQDGTAVEFVNGELLHSSAVFGSPTPAVDTPAAEFAQATFAGVTFPNDHGLGVGIYPPSPSSEYAATPFTARNGTFRGLGDSFPGGTLVDTTLNRADDVIAFDSTGAAGAVAITLPFVAQVPDGHPITFTHVMPALSATTVTLSPQAGETLDFGVVVSIPLAISERVTLRANASSLTWIVCSTG